MREETFEVIVSGEACVANSTELYLNLQVEITINTYSIVVLPPLIRGAYLLLCRNCYNETINNSSMVTMASKILAVVLCKHLNTCLH